MLKILLISCSIFLFDSCMNKRCNEADDLARTKSKDPALMYIWRLTNNQTTKEDSGFISLKPNGDIAVAPLSFYIEKSKGKTWYTNNNIIRELYCLDQVPLDHSFAKYFIKNDTLYLFDSINDSGFATLAKTYIHVKKY
jgi:hypothetical protein